MMFLESKPRSRSFPRGAMQFRQHFSRRSVTGDLISEYTIGTTTDGCLMTERSSCVGLQESTAMRLSTPPGDFVLGCFTANPNGTTASTFPSICEFQTSRTPTRSAVGGAG